MIKFRTISKDLNQYESLILLINLLVFSILLIVSVSKTKIGLFIISYKIIKQIIEILKNIYFLFFNRKRLFQKRVRNIKKELSLNRKANKS